VSKSAIRADGDDSSVAITLNADVRQPRIGSGKRGQQGNRQRHTQKLLQPHLYLSSRSDISTERGAD